MLDAFTAATHPANAVGSDASQESHASVDGPAALHERVQRLQGELKFANTTIAALNFELAKLKRYRFGASSENLDASTQAVLFDQIVIDTAQEDRAAAEAATPASAPPKVKRQAVRQPLNPQLPRVEVHHDLASTVCHCGQPMKRVGEETSEKMAYKRAEFFVELHIRGKYACACCQTIVAAPMPAQIIDKGIPAPSLLAQIIIAKHDDHLPLYRQEEIYARSGVHIARSSMAQWVGICGLRLAPLAQALREYILTHSVVHADETPVKLLVPGRGKTKNAYVWVYRTTDFATKRAVLFDFALSRSGEHPRRVLQGFTGTLVTDDFSGYHALTALGVTSVLCWAHARRKLFDAFKLTDSQIAGQAVVLIAKLYEIEREARTLSSAERLLLRQARSRPLTDALHAWYIEQRQKLAKADVTAKAIDYSLSNWKALTRFLDDGDIPIDNNAAENAIRPLRVGRRNWLFVGS